MNLLKKLLLYVVIFIVVGVIALYAYLQTTGPDYEGTLTLDGLKQEVTVRYDKYGVPHIEAANEEDAYFALGYVHAQDRLFQMEMLRRAAAGRLSEILGNKLMATDKLFRTLGINQFAEEHSKKFLSSDTAAYQRASFAYLKGLNAFVRNGKTPLEFSIIGIPKEEFTPRDIYLALGFMSFTFAEGLRVDPVLEKIRTEYGDEYLKDLAVQTPSTAVRIRSYKGEVMPHHQDSLISYLQEALNNIPMPLWSGSNGWVIAGSRTQSGKPILANDTHIGFAQPAVWYEAHLEYPGSSFYGHHIAGVPFGFLGNNRFAGWGLTMFENDDMDFYYESINPENPGQVQYKGQWQELDTREEVIKVKGEADVTITVKETPHGPIINDIMGDLVTAKQPVSLWWLLTHDTNEALSAAYRLNHLSSFEEAQSVAAAFSAPGLNVMYADVDGNIAWWAVAKLPKRPKHVVSKFFLDGASGKDDFDGYYDFSKNPQAFNPSWGYVYSANNQPDSVDGVLYPGYYYPRSRAGRIVELISENKKWTVDDVKRVNLDVVSRMHVDIAKEMAAHLQQLNRQDLKDLIDILSAWNGDHQMNDIAPSIYYNLLGHYMALAMKDELGEKAYQSILKTSITKNSFDLLLTNKNSPWWDIVTTKDKKETRADIMSLAADRTIANLQRTSGPNPSDWTWSKIHAVNHPHPLGAVKPLDKFFNVGPIPAPGGSEVINNLHFTIDTTGYFTSDGGPALRKITDFADLDHGVTVSPTGQSGNRMSPHYSDQAQMYVNGESRLMMMNGEEIRKEATSVLVLKPR
ncbi:MAG: penicillin acylase family protein [Bacteroidetes bacterium]|nr:penicillin acylase family protein [Bacteroidota bacterium]